MPTSIKEPVQNTTPLPATLIIPFPDCKTEKEGLTTVMRLARQEYLRIRRAQHPVHLRQGRSNDLYYLVTKACHEAWVERGPRLRMGPMSMLVESVKRRLPLQYRSRSVDHKRDTTIENHVRAWIGHYLTPKDFPVHLLRNKPTGGEIVRLECEETLYCAYFIAIVQARFTPGEQRRLTAAAKKRVKDQIATIPITELVQIFIETRDSGFPYPALLHRLFSRLNIKNPLR